MIVCHCKGISDRTIRKAVREGAQTAGEVGRACHAGKMCGGCTPAIDEILEHESEREGRRNLLGLVELATG